MEMNFKRRKCDVERYNNAVKMCKELTFDELLNSVKERIKEFETFSEIIDLFRTNPNLIVEDNNNSKDGKVYKLPIRIIGRSEDGYFVTDGKLVCQLVGENYADERLNIGKDYHSLHVCANTKEIDYWHSRYNSFLLFQLKNQDKLEEICYELSKMKKNHFYI